jgi:hypothetical protein
MNRDMAAHSTYHTDRHSLRNETSPLDGLEGLAEQRRIRRAMPMLALLLSLGLWAAIWAVVRSLASAVLG